MFYAIDYDTRTVESKNKNDNLLQKYIVNNELEMAVALVSNAEELVLKFSLREMNDLYSNLGGKETLLTENTASEKCWEALEKNQRKFPTFTKKLGQKLAPPPKPKRAKKKLITLKQMVSKL